MTYQAPLEVRELIPYTPFRHYIWRGAYTHLIASWTNYVAETECGIHLEGVVADRIFGRTRQDKIDCPGCVEAWKEAGNVIHPW